MKIAETFCKKFIYCLIAFAIFIPPSLLIAADIYGKEFTLSWNANTEADLSKYNVYQRNLLTFYKKGRPLISLDKSVTSTKVTVINSRIFYWAITAVDTNGNESGYSNEVNSLLIWGK